MGTDHQPEFDSKTFGPFGPLFDVYASFFERTSQACGVANPFSAQTDVRDLSERMGAPFKALMRSQLAWSALANKRAQAYMHIGPRLAQCRTPHDVVNEQLAFWRTATEQYTEGYRRIFDAWSPLDVFGETESERAERDYINFSGSKDRDVDAPPMRQEAIGQRRVA
jgi:hypothetical protein